MAVGSNAIARGVSFFVTNSRKRGSKASEAASPLQCAQVRN
jgi:hypothetical protein